MRFGFASGSDPAAAAIVADAKYGVPPGSVLAGGPRVDGKQLIDARQDQDRHRRWTSPL